MLDGVEVQIKDTVYVLGIGYGEVVSVSSDGSFKVKIGRSVQEYRSGGMLGNNRRVFWHDPLYIVPPKDATLWSIFKEQATYNYGLLVRVLQGGVKAPASEATDEDTE